MKAPAVAQYKSWLKGQLTVGYPRVVKEIERLKKMAIANGTLDIACWCTAPPCHAYVIKEEIEHQLKEEGYDVGH